MNYEELFSRNFSIFTREEQEKIRRGRVYVWARCPKGYDSWRCVNKMLDEAAVVAIPDGSTSDRKELPRYSKRPVRRTPSPHCRLDISSHPAVRERASSGLFPCTTTDMQRSATPRNPRDRRFWKQAPTLAQEILEPGPGLRETRAAFGRLRGATSRIIPTCFPGVIRERSIPVRNASRPTLKN
jgi:hypothetical protein